MTSLVLGWLASHWLLVAAVVVGIAAALQPVLVWKFKAWILLAVVLWWGWTGHAAFKSATAALVPLRADLATERQRVEGFRDLLKQVNAEADRQIADAKKQADAGRAAAAAAKMEAERLAGKLTDARAQLEAAKRDPDCAGQLEVTLCSAIPLL